jgi:hypothetical protein
MARIFVLGTSGHVLTAQDNYKKGGNYVVLETEEELEKMIKSCKEALKIAKDNRKVTIKDKLSKSLPLGDGTDGKRFPWGLYRKRQKKTRYGIKFGPTMLAIHSGRRSLYIEKKAPLKYLHNFAG